MCATSGVGEVRASGNAVLQATMEGLGLAKDGYCARAVARKVIGCAHEVENFGVRQGVMRADIKAWLPDELAHAAPLDGMSTVEAYNVFAVSPLWISCFACFAAQLRSHIGQEMLEIELAKVRPARERIMKGGNMWPAMHSVVAAIMDRPVAEVITARGHESVRRAASIGGHMGGGDDG